MVNMLPLGVIFGADHENLTDNEINLRLRCIIRNYFLYTGLESGITDHQNFRKMNKFLEDFTLHHYMNGGLSLGLRGLSHEI